MNTTTRHEDLEVRWGSVITLLLVTAAIIAGIFIAFPTERPASQFAASPVVEPVAAPAVVEPVVEPVACALVDGPVLDNLAAAGHELDYDGSTGAWRIDGSLVGHADAEDEAFTGCGSPALVDTLREAQP